VRRLEPQIRKRIILLGGGDNASAAIQTFATLSAPFYKEGLKIVEGIWLPALVANVETPLYWDKASTPYRFSLQPIPDALGVHAVSMKAIFEMLGLWRAEEPEEQEEVEQADKNLAAQVAEMRKTIDLLTKTQNATVEAGRLAAASFDGVRANNPSNVFVLGNTNSNNNNGSVAIQPQIGSPTSAAAAQTELVKALSGAGATPTQIIQFLQTQGSGAAGGEKGFYFAYPCG
jgi:hypothetical protein